MSLVALEDARAYVLSCVHPLEPLTVPLAEADGSVLAGDVFAGEDVPPFDNTAVDGYAVRSVDLAAAAPGPVRLPVVAEVAAGHPATNPLGPGQAMRIFTGAVMPEGADAVVMVEDTDRLDGGATVEVRVPVSAGAHVRHAGDDLSRGARVFAAGEGLGPAHLGVLASLGITVAQVVRRPVVGVLSTGDELVAPGRALAPGQIRDSNRVAVAAAVRRCGFEVVDLGLVRDDEAAITAAVEAAVGSGAGCDALVTSGGVSMGDIDLVRVVLDRMGEMRWMQIAIRPAKPFAFGLVGPARRPVFGLPGNPVSSLVSFELLARPALRAMAGHRDPLRAPVLAVAGADLLRRPDGKVHFLRVALRPEGDGTLVALALAGQGSHQLSGLAGAQGLAVLADGEGVRSGDPVPVLVLEEVGEPGPVAPREGGGAGS